MKATFQNFEVTAVLAYSGVTFPNTERNYGLHNQYKVTVLNTETKVKVSFDFYGSQHDFDNGKTELDEYDLLNAFYCLLSDGLSVKDADFVEFCQEFGYDIEYLRTAKKVYNACKKQLVKAEKIMGDKDIYEFINELQEVAG